MPILTACATCGSALKESYPVLADGESQEWKDRVKAFSSKVMDISEFLKEKITMNRTEKQSLTKVTYHDPCHLVRGQNITAQPRAILRELPGIEYAEMRDAQRCCGGGGSFSFYNYDLSKQISKRKIDNIEATGASVVVTGCPGCMLQMKDQLGTERLTGQGETHYPGGGRSRRVTRQVQNPRYPVSALYFFSAGMYSKESRIALNAARSFDPSFSKII